jgi:lipoprotein-anchoring transpeptidase ErfK/SrfK
MFFPTNRSSRLVFPALCLAIAVGSPIVSSAATKPAIKVATKTVKVTRNPCANYPLLTTVAAFNDGKFGAGIKVWPEPKETEQVKATIGVGIEVKARPTFTVIETAGDWYHVRIPVRPNGADGYVRKQDVTTYQHPWTIVVELGRKELTVCNSGRAVQIEKVGVGTAKTPTPTGTCYIADLIKQKNPKGGYGPFAYGLSCFSDVVFSFGAGGDGRLGIHGTNNPAGLGTAVSNGCIRLSNTAITKMSKTLPLGVPVFIVS